MSIRTAQYYANEVQHAVQKNLRYGAGVGARQSVTALMGIGAGFLNIKTQLVTRLIGLSGIVLGAFVTNYINEMDRSRKAERLTYHLRREIGSLMGKEPTRVTVQDLEAVASQNHAIQHYLSHIGTESHVKTGLWVLCALATALIVPAILPLLTGGVAIGALATAALSGAIGLASFMTVKKISQPIAYAAFDLNKHTAMQQICRLADIKKVGGKITEAQVYDVILAVQKEKSQFTGQAPSNPEDILKKLNTDLKTLTQDIIEERISARELTFIAEEQRSGAQPDPSIRKHVSLGLGKVTERIADLREQGAQRLQAFKQNLSALRGNAPDQTAENSQTGRLETQSARGKAPDVPWGKFVTQRKLQQAANKELAVGGAP